MPYLLLAIAICLLVPWLPVVLLRLAPVRAAPPLSPEEMERLRAQLFPHLAKSAARTRPADPKRQAIAVEQQIEPQPDEVQASTTPRQSGGRSLTVRSYQWVNLVVLPFFLMSMLGLAIGWAVVFNFLGEQHARTFPSGVFVFKPAVYWAIFGVPAVFLGIFGSVVIVDPLTRILLGRRYTEYCHWEQARRGLHGPVGVQLYSRRFILFAVVLGILMAGWTVLAMNWYVRLSDNEIALKPLFGVREQVYPYSRVQQIVLTTHVVVKNDIIPREGLHLRFDNDQTWSTGQTFALPDAPEEKKHLLDFLTRKTGKPLTKARLLDDVPGW